MDGTTHGRKSSGEGPWPRIFSETAEAAEATRQSSGWPPTSAQRRRTDKNRGERLPRNRDVAPEGHAGSSGENTTDNASPSWSRGWNPPRPLASVPDGDLSRPPLRSEREPLLRARPLRSARADVAGAGCPFTCHDSRSFPVAVDVKTVDAVRSAPRRELPPGPSTPPRLAGRNPLSHSVPVAP